MKQYHVINKHEKNSFANYVEGGNNEQQKNDMKLTSSAARMMYAKVRGQTTSIGKKKASMPRTGTQTNFAGLVRSGTTVNSYGGPSPNAPSIIGPSTNGLSIGPNNLF